MKKNVIFLWSFLAISLLSVLILCGSLLTQPELPDTQTESETETTAYFMVRAQDDRVVVCRNEETEPILVLDVSLGSLPPYDREKISAGMRLNTLADLEQFIEDFDS